MDQPADPRCDGSLQQQLEGCDVELAKIFQSSPVADLCGAIEDPVGTGRTAPERLAIFQVADDLLDPPTVEPARVARGPDQDPEAMPASKSFLHSMAAHQARAAGEENGFGW